MKKIIFLVVMFLSYTWMHAQSDGIFAVISTPKGEFTIELLYKDAPITCANFIGLAEGKIPNYIKDANIPYYNGLSFHRVVPNGITQGGCPIGNGDGTPGYRFKDELVDHLKHDGVGIVSMANSGKNTNGSQFFITHKALPKLDGVHAVFGKVISGMDVVLKIEEGDQIIKITIVRKGDDANSFDVLKIFPEKLRKYE